MKVERIVLRNVHAHRDTSWSPNGARLVALVGPNGAGKSTLASDALRYALYGELRAGPDGIVTLGQTDASVLVEFAFGGARYRVVRGRTTKAGGKSFLELAVADGEAWRPLTRETIRETELAIAELLRMDAATFDAAVVLSQGQILALADGTAAERKRVLGQVLGLDEYAKAEAEARERARDVAARIDAGRSLLERYADTDLELDGERQVLVDARQQLGVEAEMLEDLAAQRAPIEARIRELDAALATSATLEAERASLTEAWHRAKARASQAIAVATSAEESLAAADEVATAVAALPAQQAELDRLVAIEADDRKLGREIGEAAAELASHEANHGVAVARWTAHHDAAAAKVAELEAHGKAGTSVCEACGQLIDRDTAIAQLDGARGALAAIGEQPAEPMSIARTRALHARLEARQRELAFDPGALAAAHRTVTKLAGTAARAEAIAGAREVLARAIADRGAAENELAQVAARGTEVAAQMAKVEPFREERSTAAARLEGVLALARGAEGRRRTIEAGIAGSEVRIAALEADIAERDRLQAELGELEVSLARLRREVQAFGAGGIPARIVERNLPELAGYANDLLAELRPGMTLDLRAQRAKKSGDGVIEALDLVVRDVAGERAFGLFSGGERMTIALALAVALSRLAARRSGAPIGLLVVDEPDGLDADVRRAFGQAMRGIAHRGELAQLLMVSHHSDLAEFADETYQVVKGPDGSVVSLVA